MSATTSTKWRFDPILDYFLLLNARMPTKVKRVLHQDFGREGKPYGVKLDSEENNTHINPLYGRTIKASSSTAHIGHPMTVLPPFNPQKESQ